jgi:hypothetical protein
LQLNAGLAAELLAHGSDLQLKTDAVLAQIPVIMMSVEEQRARGYGYT